MNDEQAIRDLVAKWMSASQAGDTEAVLELMTDDAVFLTPGRAPMDKAAFAAASRGQSGPGAPRIEGASDIQEIQVAGEWAFMWSKLAITVTPAQGGPVKRTGHTLSVLRKQNGKWRLARDANLLAPA